MEALTKDLMEIMRKLLTDTITKKTAVISSKLIAQDWSRAA
jgi:hypothetical protein